MELVLHVEDYVTDVAPDKAVLHTRLEGILEFRTIGDSPLLIVQEEVHATRVLASLRQPQRIPEEVQIFSAQGANFLGQLHVPHADKNATRLLVEDVDHIGPGVASVGSPFG